MADDTQKFIKLMGKTMDSMINAIQCRLCGGPIVYKDREDVYRWERQNEVHNTCAYKWNQEVEARKKKLEGK